MAQTRESFLLNNSQPFDLSRGAESRSDLTLTPSTDLNKSSIVTIVSDGANPITDALVKVLTQSGDPVDHQFSNEIGHSISTPLDTGIYQVVASAPGFITSLPVTVNLPAVTTYFLNITLSGDPRAVQNTLYGLVLDQVSEKRIDSAIVILADTAGQTVATTQTNTDGEYLLYQVDNGSYLITAEKPGYLLMESLPVTVTGSQMAKTDLSLSPEVNIESTVQGFIKDPDGNFISRASVGLYSVSDSTETLIRLTYTNANGFYLFGNLPAGRYLIKANLETVV